MAGPSDCMISRTSSRCRMNSFTGDEQLHEEWLPLRRTGPGHAARPSPLICLRSIQIRGHRPVCGPHAGTPTPSDPADRRESRLPQKSHERPHHDPSRPSASSPGLLVGTTGGTMFECRQSPRSSQRCAPTPRTSGMTISSRSASTTSDHPEPAGDRMRCSRLHGRATRE